MAKTYTPDRGDIVYLKGNSYPVDAEKTCVLVLSPKKYNSKVGLILCCPVSPNRLGYPFEVIDDALTGAILADQVKSVEWLSNGLIEAGRVEEGTLEEVLAKLSLLLTVQK